MLLSCLISFSYICHKQFEAVLHYSFTIHRLLQQDTYTHSLKMLQLDSISEFPLSWLGNVECWMPTVILFIWYGLPWPFLSSNQEHKLFKPKTIMFLKRNTLLPKWQTPQWIIICIYSLKKITSLPSRKSLPILSRMLNIWGKQI